MTSVTHHRDRRCSATSLPPEQKNDNEYGKAPTERRCGTALSSRLCDEVGAWEEGPDWVIGRAIDIGRAKGKDTAGVKGLAEGRCEELQCMPITWAVG